MDKQEFSKILEIVRSGNMKAMKRNIVLRDGNEIEERTETILNLKDFDSNNLRLAHFKGKTILLVNNENNDSKSMSINFYVLEKENESYTAYDASGLTYRKEFGYSTTCWLINIWVSPQYLGYGIGSYGLIFLEEKAAEMRAYQIEGELRVTRAEPYGWIDHKKNISVSRAELMYEKNGFNFYIDGYQSMICKNIKPENIANINANCEIIDGVKVYNPLNEWTKNSIQQAEEEQA